MNTKEDYELRYQAVAIFTWILSMTVFAFITVSNIAFLPILIYSMLAGIVMPLLGSIIGEYRYYKSDA
jgi:hypothetical protein